MNDQDKKKKPRSLREEFDEFIRQGEEEDRIKSNPYAYVTEEGETLRFKTPNARLLWKQRLKDMRDEKSKLSDREEAALRIQTQSFGNLPVPEGSKYIGSAIGTIDSMQVGLKPQAKAPEDAFKIQKKQDEIKKRRIRIKSEKEGVGALTNEEGRILWGAEKWDDMRKTKKKVDKREVFTKKMLGAEKIMTAERKIGEDFSKKGKIIDLMEPIYSEKLRGAATQTHTAYADSIYWMNQSNRLKSQGIDISPQELDRKYEQGKMIVENIMDEFKSGELQKKLPVVRPEALKGYLKKYIDQQLKPLGLDYDDVLYFDKRGK